MQHLNRTAILAKLPALKICEGTAGANGTSPHDSQWAAITSIANKIG